MNAISQIARSFCWKPSGLVSSMEFLELSQGLIAKHDVTAAVGGQYQERHPLAVVELADGKVVGDLRLAATRNDVVIGGLQTIFGCGESQNHYILRRRRFRIPKFRHGTALLLGAANSDNYYHWLLDSLPRWKILQTAGEADYDFVLLHSQPVRFQDDVLDRLNVPASKRLRCSKNFVHQFERLVVPAMPFPPEEVTPWACAWVRSLFPEITGGPEKVYLRRGTTGRRVLVNEPELEAALAKEGFVSVQPGQMTIVEQAQFLSGARCVVAPHGAALTNMVFAPPGATLVELFHPQHKNHCYVNLAAACGHYYACLDGRVVSRGEDRDSEYGIDVSAVLETLKRTV